MSEAQRRRSSASISLVLIGAASVTGCGDPAPVNQHRDVYQHQSQCVQDWGDSKKCEVITSGPYRGSWYGPSYTIGSDGMTSPRRSSTMGSASSLRSGTGATGAGDPAAAKGGSPNSSRAVATHSVSRGGFGATASAHGSSGS